MAQTRCSLWFGIGKNYPKGISQGTYLKVNTSKRIPYGKIMYQEKEYACSFELALDMFSGKWKGLILWHLSQRTMRYSELKKSLLGKNYSKMPNLQTFKEEFKKNPGP